MSDQPPLIALAAGYGPRLRAARQAIGKTAKDLAQSMNVSPQRWSHWEVERHPPDFFVMLALKHRYGVSLDWIYAGDWRNLPGHILQFLLNLSAQPDAPAPLVQFRGSFLAGADPTRAGSFHEPASPIKRG